MLAAKFRPLEVVVTPGAAQFFEVVANQQWPAALTKVMDLAGLVFPAAQAALQMRQCIGDSWAH